MKPTFRFFVIPLGAIVTLASLSGQNAVSRTARDATAFQVRQEVVCSAKSPAEVCVIVTGDEATR